MDEVLTLEFDGGSRGNPGPAGIGAVVRAKDGTTLKELGRFIGRATNNVAEYKALITALQMARELGARKVVIRGDSELIVRQMNGQYRVKNADLKPLYNEAQSLLRQFDHATIDHNYRHKNALADKLANLAMDRKADVTDVDGESDGPPGGGARNPADDVDAPAPAPPRRTRRSTPGGLAPQNAAFECSRVPPVPASRRRQSLPICRILNPHWQANGLS